MALAPIESVHLFPGLREALLDLLGLLSPEEWQLPTPCDGWTVHDVALHLLGDDIGKLSGGRDRFHYSAFADGLDISSFSGLVNAIDRQNELWVRAGRRISPQLTIYLLSSTGQALDDHRRTLDLEGVGVPVNWAGPAPAPVWLDIAREYTERWHHQQHIREAVSRPGMMEAKWLRPVLETFVHGLKRSLRVVQRAEGTSVTLFITGTAGSTWTAVRTNSTWDLIASTVENPAATVHIPQEIAWRLFTKGVTPEYAQRHSECRGDVELIACVYQTVSILAE